MTAERVPYITEEEYLEGETHSEVRQEYFDGVVFAMAGATKQHERVAMNFSGRLWQHLLGNGCQVFKGDMSLRLPPFMGKGLYYYPDVMVTCDPTDADEMYCERPKLIIEVLSKDQEQDWLTKALVYRRIPSLDEYVIADSDPDAPAVHVSRRADGWEPIESFTALDGEFTLRSVDLTLKVADLFAV
ncbi:MAG: Uma2 family endonuclease [Chthoniobacteraceae bacterium]